MCCFLCLWKLLVVFGHFLLVICLCLVVFLVGFLGDSLDFRKKKQKTCIFLCVYILDGVWVFGNSG